MLIYVLVSHMSWITTIKSEYDGIITLEFPTMLERTVKSYKQETKKLKQNHRPQFHTDDRIHFKRITLRLY